MRWPLQRHLFTGHQPPPLARPPDHLAYDHALRWRVHRESRQILFMPGHATLPRRGGDLLDAKISLLGSSLEVQVGLPGPPPSPSGQQNEVGDYQ